MKRILILLLFAPYPAFACSTLMPAAFVLDPASDDSVAPSSPGPPLPAEVLRGSRGDCVVTPSSCDHIGHLRLQFPAAEDDRSPHPEPSHRQTGVGYRVRLAAGTLPDGLALDENVRAAWLFDGQTATVDLTWIDGASESQEAFAATLAITSVDVAGNESAPVSLDVSDPGKLDNGRDCRTAQKRGLCSITPADAGAPILLSAAVLLLRRRSSKPAAGSDANRSMSQS